MKTNKLFTLNSWTAYQRKSAETNEKRKECCISVAEFRPFQWVFISDRWSINSFTIQEKFFRVTWMVSKTRVFFMKMNEVAWKYLLLIYLSLVWQKATGSDCQQDWLCIYHCMKGFRKINIYEKTKKLQLIWHDDKAEINSKQVARCFANHCYTKMPRIVR